MKHWGDNMLRFDRVNEQEQLCSEGRLGDAARVTPLTVALLQRITNDFFKPFHEGASLCAR
jgi:hypothetical protein